MIYRGCEGSVKVGGNVIAEVKSWSLSETTEIIDVSVLGDCNKRKKAGMQDATGSLTAQWDDEDTSGQGALTNGAEIELTLYPGGDAVGKTFATLQAIITTVGKTGAVDGIVELSFDFEATGGVVWGPVV